MTSPSVRWFRDADAALCAAIDRAAPEITTWSELAFRVFMHRPDSIFLVAEVGQTPVGYAIAIASKKAIRLIRVVIHPQHRRQGHGRRLLGLLLSRLLEGRRRLVTEVPFENLPAAHWLKRSGLRAVSSSDTAIRFKFTARQLVR